MSRRLARPLTLLMSEVFPPKTGGSGRWFWEIYRRFERDRVVIAAGEDSRQEEFDATHDLDLFRVPLTMTDWGIRSWAGLRGYWQARRAVKRILRQRRVGMIHCGRVIPEGVLALSLGIWRRVPFACYVHGEDVNMLHSSRELTFLVRHVLRRCRFVIANSQNSRRLLLEDWAVPEERVQVLHPGVDTNFFVPAPRDEAARRRLGWSQRRVVLTVGRLQRRKGQDQMIRALPEIRLKVPDVLYAITGGGGERQALESLAMELGVADLVQFLGEVDDQTLLECYQQCDLFALPNREIDGDIEGFGMVLLEAQACGKPVLAGDSGGTAETMRIPETGRIVDCTSPGPLASTVVELLSDSPGRERMGREARDWVENRFSWESLTAQAKRMFDVGNSSDEFRTSGVQ